MWVRFPLFPPEIAESNPSDADIRWISAVTSSKTGDHQGVLDSRYSRQKAAAETLVTSTFNRPRCRFESCWSLSGRLWRNRQTRGKNNQCRYSRLFPETGKKDVPWQVTTDRGRSCKIRSENKNMRMCRKGRQAVLRTGWSDPCGFESHHPYHMGV